MLITERLRNQMKAQGLSQAALARRVGISQQSIGRLVSGESFGSRYLHKIARELHTTAAYLSGETDDPVSELPDDDFLVSAEERDWVELLRAIPPKERAAALTLVRTIASSAQSPRVHE
jgi:transcriptional regulator with XRE-family HTH domain